MTLMEVKSRGKYFIAEARRQHEMDAQEIYTKMFSDPQYAKEGPRLFRYDWAIEYLLSTHCSNATTVCDIGSGRGDFVKRLIETNRKLRITAIDVSNFHGQEGICHLNVDLNDLTGVGSLLLHRFDFGACLDVLEHLCADRIDFVLSAISQSCRNVAATIANHSEIHDGIQLHTIQENSDWWSDRVSKHFQIVRYATHYNSRLYAFWLKSHHSSDMI